MSGNQELLNIIKSNVANTMYNEGILGRNDIIGSGLVGGAAKKKTALDKQKTIVARLKLAKDVYKGMPPSPHKKAANEKYRKALARLRSLKKRRAGVGTKKVGVRKRKVGVRKRVPGRRKATAANKILKELKKIAAKIK